jgi:glycosidase
MGKSIIYQMLPRLWGAINNQPGKFSDIDNPTLEYLVSLGVSHVWYTGVIRHATTYSCMGCPASSNAIVKGSAGSPYAIVDYYDVNPYLADKPENRIGEFKCLLKRTHAHDLKAIIDFVPNHVSRDYGKVGLVNGNASPFGSDDDSSVSWKASNDFYYFPGQALRLPGIYSYDESPAKASGNVFSPNPGVNDWYDTIKLNYCDFRTSTWDKMLDIVKYWCSMGVDGFRCDMVELVPWQFMQWLIQNVKKEYPDVIFIGEVYKKELYRKYVDEVGFDYLYDKSGLYDSLRALVEGHGTAKSITWNWQSLGDLQPHMLNFLENHDEQRFASDFFAKDARRTFAPLGAGLLLNTAPYMIYFGEEIGERGMDQEGFSGLDGRTSIFDWWSINSIGRLRKYIHKNIPMQADEMALLDKWRKFLNLAYSEAAFSIGRNFDLCYCNADSTGFNPDCHYAFLRASGQTAFLVVCNFSDSESRISVRIPPEAVSYLGLGKKTPETIEVTVPGSDCIVRKI